MSFARGWSLRCNRNLRDFFALFVYTSRALSLTKIPTVLPSELLHEPTTMATVMLS
jgi:hypothetical protein